jgi:hypothetical protein
MRILFIVIFCFFLGATVSALFAPSIVSWYFDPPTAIGVSCKEAVTWGITAYQKMVLVGGVIGLLGGIAMAIVLRGKKPVSTV